MSNSKSHIRELFQHTLIYGVAIVLNKSVSFILLPIYTKYFSPEEIGTYALVQSISLFLGIFYTLGLETSFMKFFVEAKEQSSKSEIYSTTLIFILISSLIFSIILYFFSDSISVLVKFENFKQGSFLVKLLPVILFFDTLYRFPLLLFRANLKTKTYAWINLLTFAVNIILNFYFITFLRTGVEGIFYSYIISVALTFLAGIFLTKNYLSLKISLKKFFELLSFGNKFIYIGICLILIDQSDRFFLKYYLDESTVGIYSANYRLAAVMSLMIASFRFSWTPYFLNLTSNPEHKKIISNIFTYFVFAGLFLFLVLSIFIEPFVKLRFFGLNFLDSVYWTGLKIIPIILLSYFFTGLSSIIQAAPFFKNKTYTLLIVVLLSVVINVILNFLLIPSLDMLGAALATLLTNLLTFVIAYIYSQKIYNISYNWNVISKLGIIALIIFLVQKVLQGGIDSPLLNFLAGILLIIFFPMAINFMKILDIRKVSLLWKDSG